MSSQNEIAREDTFLFFWSTSRARGLISCDRSGKPALTGNILFKFVCAKHEGSRTCNAASDDRLFRPFSANFWTTKLNGNYFIFLGSLRCKGWRGECMHSKKTWGNAPGSAFTAHRFCCISKSRPKPAPSTLVFSSSSYGSGTRSWLVGRWGSGDRRAPAAAAWWWTRSAWIHLRAQPAGVWNRVCVSFLSEYASGTTGHLEGKKRGGGGAQRISHHTGEITVTSKVMVDPRGHQLSVASWSYLTELWDFQIPLENMPKQRMNHFYTTFCAI